MADRRAYGGFWPPMQVELRAFTPISSYFDSVELLPKTMDCSWLIIKPTSKTSQNRGSVQISAILLSNHAHGRCRMRLHDTYIR